MAFTIHDESKKGIVSLRSTLASTITGMIYRSNQTLANPIPTVEIHTTNHMTATAACIFEKHGFVPVEMKQDKIILSCPANVDKLAQFFKAFIEIGEPLDSETIELLTKIILDKTVQVALRQAELLSKVGGNPAVSNNNGNSKPSPADASTIPPIIKPIP